MRHWNAALKEWEQTVIRCFPAGARILDIGCGLGREAFEAADLSRFAEQAGMDILYCGEGNIYKPEDGTILHCLCRK